MTIDIYVNTGNLYRATSSNLVYRASANLTDDFRKQSRAFDELLAFRDRRGPHAYVHAHELKPLLPRFMNERQQQEQRRKNGMQYQQLVLEDCLAPCSAGLRRALGHGNGLVFDLS